MKYIYCVSRVALIYPGVHFTMSERIKNRNLVLSQDSQDYNPDPIGHSEMQPWVVIQSGPTPGRPPEMDVSAT